MPVQKFIGYRLSFIEHRVKTKTKTKQFEI